MDDPRLAGIPSRCSTCHGSLQLQDVKLQEGHIKFRSLTAAGEEQVDLDPSQASLIGDMCEVSGLPVRSKRRDGAHDALHQRQGLLMGII